MTTLAIVAALSTAVTAFLFKIYYSKNPSADPEMLYMPIVSAPIEPVEETIISKSESMPEPTNPAPLQPTEASLYLWSTQKQSYHSVRVICDEVGLTVAQKNILCACVFQESRFKNSLSPGVPTKNVNHFKDGSISTDYGIVQVNDYWNIGKGKPFPSVQYVMDNPDKVVRWMANIYKTTGRLQPWSSYTSGAYKQWLASNSPMWTLRT